MLTFPSTEWFSRLGELMERDIAEIARLSVLDNGMSAGMSQPLVGIMANWTSYYAGWADKVEGRVTSFPANQRELLDLCRLVGGQAPPRIADECLEAFRVYGSSTEPVLQCSHARCPLLVLTRRATRL